MLSTKFETEVGRPAVSAPLLAGRDALKRETVMFRWAIIFAVVALVAALLGFGGIAGLSADFAKILLVVGVILFIVAFLFRGKRTLP
jgi:uncharacterized membrane protein YtjA (UPF0391 family)